MHVEQNHLARLQQRRQIVDTLSTVGKADSADLNATLLNIVINGAGIAGTSWLFQRDLKARRRDKASVEREESLARLQVAHLA